MTAIRKRQLPWGGSWGVNNSSKGLPFGGGPLYSDPGGSVVWERRNRVWHIPLSGIQIGWLEKNLGSKTNQLFGLIGGTKNVHCISTSLTAVRYSTCHWSGQRGGIYSHNFLFVTRGLLASLHVLLRSSPLFSVFCSQHVDPWESYLDRFYSTPLPLFWD